MINSSFRRGAFPRAAALALLAGAACSSGVNDPIICTAQFVYGISVEARERGHRRTRD